MEAHFDFEKPIATLEKKLQDLRELSSQEGMDLSEEIALLEKRVHALIEETYLKLSSWQKVQLSRHPNRPYTKDYLEALYPSFMELHGDRAYSDDQAIIGGVADTPSGPILILGHQKGRTTKQKMERNFGMAKPEGYRKAIRLMDLANRSGMPILTLIDTPGAYPGIETEERGQAQAIAESIQFMFTLKVPVVAVVIGEGGSGGALALGVANRVFMQEYSTYSVISPEGCASILWSDATLAERASEKLKMGPSDLLKSGVIDGMIPEPKGGAHRDWAEAAKNLRTKVEAAFAELQKLSAQELQEDRLKKFRSMGANAIAKTQGAEAR
jgi:acetyl-CoA carboxylase carboxyl transferase subunit alpha